MKDADTFDVQKSVTACFSSITTPAGTTIDANIVELFAPNEINDDAVVVTAKIFELVDT